MKTLMNKEEWENTLKEFTNLDSDDDFILCGEAAHYPWVECGYKGNAGRYTHRMFNFEHKLWREMTLADFNSCDPELNGVD